MYQGRLSSSTSTPRPSLIVLIRYVYNSIHCILLCGPKSHVFTVYKSVKWDLPNMMILAPWTNVVSHQLLSPNLRAARVHDSILTLSHMSMWQIHPWIVSHFWREAAVFMCCQHFLPLSSFTDLFAPSLALIQKPCFRSPGLSLRSSDGAVCLPYPDSSLFRGFKEVTLACW